MIYRTGKRQDDEGPSGFGPFYSVGLQVHVNHAERLVAALKELETEILCSRFADPANPTDGEVWLLGRAGEVEAFVSDLTREHLAGQLAPDGATQALERYVASVHEGLREHFSLTPACCVPSVPTREINEIATRVAPFARAMAIACEGTSTPTPQRG